MDRIMLLITDRTETPGYTVGKYSDQRTYTVRLVCDPGYSDKRLTRLVSALRGEARRGLMQGILKINLEHYPTSVHARSLVDGS